MSQSHGWAELPDFLLEEVFSRLPLKYLARCSQVCSNWYRVSKTNYAGHEFHFKDYIFTRRRFTLHAGWQRHIDHPRIRLLIMHETPRWRKLVVEPVTILYNLYEFFRLLTNAATVCGGYCRNESPLRKIRYFSFEWRLHVHERDQDLEKEVGTGGEMLKSLLNLLSQLDGLDELSLRELQLETWEGNDFLDEILYKFETQLQSLCIVNFTKIPRSFLQFGLFLNLRRLVLSAQHLDEAVVILIADLKLLRALIVYQNEKTLEAKAVDMKAWLAFKENNQHTKVYLMQSGRRHRELLIQPLAPVYGIIYERSLGQLTNQVAQEICDNYAPTLRYFIQKNLERRYRSKKFCDRADFAAVDILSRCTRLKLFALRERIAYGTALLLAVIARSQSTKLCLRRNALLKRISWTRYMVTNMLGLNIDYDWLRRQCRQQCTFEEAISELTNSTATIVTDNRYLFCFESKD